MFNEVIILHAVSCLMQISAGTCQDRPAVGSMWNACLTASLRIDVSNGGEVFSADGLRYNHTTLSDVIVI
jgi:hypothetical protein